MKRKIYTQALIFALFLVVMSMLSPNVLMAQELVRPSPVEITCGEIIESEFTNKIELHEYLIGLKAGDRLNATVVPIGTTLRTRFIFHDPTGQNIANSGTEAAQSPKVDSNVISANGVYSLWVMDYSTNNRPAGVGVYTLNIGCVLRDGTVINPGNNMNTVLPTLPVPSVLPTPVVGFPGLQPVDFSSAFLTPFTLGDAFTNGQMPATGNVVIGYTFAGNAGQTFDLTYLRRGGNLNLGLVVLSPTNKVVFITGMVSSDLFTSRFTLPESGQYTIGVFTLNLVPPAAPEATSFQIKGILT